MDGPGVALKNNIHKSWQQSYTAAEHQRELDSSIMILHVVCPSQSKEDYTNLKKFKLKYIW